MHSQKTRQTAEDPGLPPWNEREQEEEEDDDEEEEGGEESEEAGCLKVPKSARKRDKGWSATLTEERPSGNRRAPRAHVDRKRTARGPGLFSREE